MRAGSDGSGAHSFVQVLLPTKKGLEKLESFFWALRGRLTLRMVLRVSVTRPHGLKGVRDASARF
jgi:hypothetical protein